MNTLNVYYVKDSYLEGIHVKQDETTDVSLKDCLCVLKFLGATQQQIQQDFERNKIIQPAYGAPGITKFGYASPIQCQYPWSYSPTHKPQEVTRVSAVGPLILLDTSQYQIPACPTMEQQNATDSFKMPDGVHR